MIWFLLSLLGIHVANMCLVQYRKEKKKKSKKPHSFEVLQKKEDDFLSRLKGAMYWATIKSDIQKENEREVTIAHQEFTFKVMVTPTNQTLILCLYKHRKLFDVGMKNDKVYYQERSIPVFQEMERDITFRLELFEWIKNMRKQWERIDSLSFIKEEIKGNNRKEGFDLFQDEQKKLQDISRNCAYLTEEENHLVCITYPKDLEELSRLYEGLDGKNKETVKDKIEKTQFELQKKLLAIECEIDKRKQREFEQKLRVIKRRE